MPTRPIVRDLTRGGVSFRIDWDVRTGYDFVFSLSGDAGSTDDLPAGRPPVAPDSLKSLHADVQAGVQDLFESELAIHAGILLVDLPAIRTSADFVDLVAETSPHDLLNALFTDDYHDDDLNQLLGRAIDGDQSAAKELSGKLPEWHKKGRLALVKDATGTHRRILAVLQAWQGKFSADRAAGRGHPRA